MTVYLSTEDVEQVGGGGHVGNLHVAVLVLSVNLVGGWVNARILIAKLEVTFQSAGRVLRALTVISMGQRHDETRSLNPFRFTRGNELINDTLGVVGEVTELSFPHDKRVRRG